MDKRPSISRFLWADFKWLFGYLALSFLAFGSLLSFAGWMLIGCLMFIAHTWINARKLGDWIESSDSLYPPDLHGLLSDIANACYLAFKTQKRLQGLLESSIKRTRDSISSLEEAVVLVDTFNRIDWWNPSAERILGLKAGDEGLHILSLLRAPQLIKKFENADFGEPLVLNSNLQVGVILKYSVTRFGDNEKLIIVEDVTKIRNLEKIRKDFVANVSHELKTPLTVFSGYLETMLDLDDLPPMHRQALMQMDEQASRMNNIVNDLLMLSKLESDHQLIHEQRVDMPALIKQLFSDASALNQHHEHRLNLIMESDACVVGVEKELRSAMSNLITNALKYTPSGGRVEVSWKNTEDKCVFSVSDTGIGIPFEHQGRLTERFYRVDAGRSRDTGGTGLGLAIVKHIVNHHRAELRIDSKPGRGSTFSIEFDPAPALAAQVK